MIKVSQAKLEFSEENEKNIYIKETNVNKCIIPKIRNSIMNLTDTTKRRNMN